MRISDWSSDVCSSDLRQRLPGKHLPHQDAPEGLRPGPLPVRGKGAQPVVQGADEDRGAAQARDRGVVPRPQPGGVGRVTSGSGGRSQTARHHRRGTARAWRRWRRDPSGPTTVRRESPGRFAFPGKEFPMAWFYLLLAGVFEIGFAIGLKYTEGFTRLWPSVATAAAAAVSLWLLTQALRTIPVGTAYAIWTGIGAVGVATVGILVFAESASPARLACIALIVRSEEHTSELQSLMRISYAVFCLKKKNNNANNKR